MILSDRDRSRLAREGQRVLRLDPNKTEGAALLMRDGRVATRSFIRNGPAVAWIKKQVDAGYAHAGVSVNSVRGLWYTSKGSKFYTIPLGPSEEIPDKEP